MSPSVPRSLRIVGLVVAALLLALAAYPGTLASPYETARGDPSYDHAIVSPSSVTYEEYASSPGIETYQYQELSPAARGVFDRTLSAPDREFEPTVCEEFLVVCDAYAKSEMPAEFTYDTGLRAEQALQFVERDGERYLLRTGHIGHAGLFGFSSLLFFAWPTVIPLGIFVGRTALNTEHAGYAVGVVGFGALVATLSLLAPYLELFDVVSAFSVGVTVLAATWLLLVAAGGHRLYRWASAERPTKTAGSL